MMKRLLWGIGVMAFQHIELPSCGISLYESKHKEKDRVREHHHAVHQILYAIEGRGRITIDRSSYEVAQDNAVVIAPYTRHSVISDSRLTLLVLAFDEKSLDSFVQRDIMNKFFKKSRYFTLNPMVSGELRQFLRKILFEQSQRFPLGSYAIKIHLLHFLLVLARFQEAPQHTDTNTLRAERIKHYIETLYYEPLTAKDISSRLGISTRYVNNIFKEQYHMTPMQYLAEVRIQTAKKLLAETDKDIATICFEVGYENLSTFYRVFKKTVNMSPNRYRQLYQPVD
ncbi:MAG: AraC family transcriptional regulator [Novibacillus thermophilus]|jgi:AraC-like DNA-binding protein|nr:AraC family transcriptional regulator [Novibacillus thermophilus]